MDVQFDLHLGTVSKAGEETVTLTRSERSALALLSSNPNRVITRDQLLDAVSEPGSDKSDRNVDFLINRLRRKLSDDARKPRFIATRYGEGYVWIADAPLSLGQIAEADLVVGPVRGLELVADEAAAGGIARGIARALDEAYGDDKRVVFAPDCPRPDQFGALAPRHAAEITFFTDRDHTDCIIAAKEFRSGRVIFARRLGLDSIADNQTAMTDISSDITRAIWRGEVTGPDRLDPLPVSLIKAAGQGDFPESVPETTSHRKLLETFGQLERKSLGQWLENEQRLRALLDDNPKDAEVKLLIALNHQSKYVSSGVSMFSDGRNTCSADEDEIEAFVTEALPSVQHDPEYAIIAGKLLHFIKRGYDDLARDLCEGAYAQSVSVGRSLAIVGQMRAFFGETDAALHCLDQALNLARPGSQAHLYALVMKCQTLSAAGRWDAVASALRELAGAAPMAGFVLEPMFGNPDAPSFRSKALAFLIGRSRARAMLMHKYYVSARLFQDPEQGANAMRSLSVVLGSRFGPDILPVEVKAAFPGLLPPR